MIALALLAATAQAGLAAPWWLLLSLVWLASVDRRTPKSESTAPGVTLVSPRLVTQPAEEVIATIYVRAGRLVLRRRRAA